MTFSDSASEYFSGWQERSLRRSLDHARARSVDQMERLLGAARNLANETGSAAFTVSQVAGTARLSLKVFYRCFAGKDELLLALLEEDSSIGAGLLRQVVEGRDLPSDRIHAYIQGLFDLLTQPGAIGYAGVLVREHRRLAEVHPDELRTALAPLVSILVAELVAAQDAGQATVPDAGRAADTIFALMLSGVSDVSLGRADPHELAEWLWDFCWAGVQGRQSEH
jgi:AcrR family transcriptional regulator